MSDWRPTATIETLRRRGRIVMLIREYFHTRSVMEVETPMLTRFGITDPAINSVAVHSVTDAEPGYLMTSPEYAMKRLLAAGAPDIFQICKVFREHESGTRHRREFTMIEWYRRDQAMAAAIDETLDLCALAGVPADRPPIKMSYRQAFKDACGIDALHDDIGTLAAVAEQRLADAGTLIASLGDDRQAWLDLLLSFIVVPNLSADRLTAIYHYPADQAALARLDPDNKEVAERFEIFYGDIELANGYRELTDANEQRRRFERDGQRRQHMNKPAMPADTLLLDALDAGLPECCGVALGLDRLVMAVTGLDDIASTISFAGERAAETPP